MSTRRPIATIASSVALAAAAVAGMAPASAQLVLRLDPGPTERTILVDDCSLRHPCSARAADRDVKVSPTNDVALTAERTARHTASSDRNVAMIRASEVLEEGGSRLHDRPTGLLR